MTASKHSPASWGINIFPSQLMVASHPIRWATLKQCAHDVMQETSTGKCKLIHSITITWQPNTPWPKGNGKLWWVSSCESGKILNMVKKEDWYLMSTVWGGHWGDKSSVTLSNRVFHYAQPLNILRELYTKSLFQNPDFVLTFVWTQHMNTKTSTTHTYTHTEMLLRLNKDSRHADNEQWGNILSDVLDVR